MPIAPNLRLLNSSKTIPAGQADTRIASIISSIALVLIGAAILMWAALLNGYPFLHYDSGAYIDSSFSLEVPQDRPIAYGLFIHFTRLYKSLWMVVLIQALITSYLLVRTALLVLPRHRISIYLAFVTLVLVAITTSVPQFVGYIQPDLFASWLFLGGALFVFSSHATDRLVGLAAVLMGTLVHNSHFALTLASVVVLLAALWLARRVTSNTDIKRTCQLVVFVCLMPLLGSAIHAWYGAEFLPSRGTPSFMVNGLVTSGILGDVLDEYCSVRQWILCQYADLIKRNQDGTTWYLWNDDSPINEIGWEQSSGEQSDIVLHSLRCCLYRIVISDLTSGWRQFWEARSILDLPVLGPSNAAFTQVSEHYPREFHAFLASRQETPGAVINHALPVGEDLIYWTFLLSSACMALVLFQQGRHRLSGWLLAPIVFSIVNAVVMGISATVVARYQGKVVWLITYVFWLVVVLLAWERLKRSRPKGNEEDLEPLQRAGT